MKRRITNRDELPFVHHLSVKLAKPGLDRVIVEAARTGKSRSAIAREALDLYFGGKPMIVEETRQ